MPTLRDAGDDPGRLSERTHEILLDVVAARFRDRVRYHTGWSWSVELAFPELSKAGLRAIGDPWRLQVELHFGDTSDQARELYSRPLLDRFESLEPAGWVARPNFHVSQVSTNLVWFTTPRDSRRAYFEHWMRRPGRIQSYDPPSLRALVDDLAAQRLIALDAETEEAYRERITGTRRSRLNACPGFSLEFSYEKDRALALDDAGALVADVRDRMREGVLVLRRGLDALA